MHVCRDGARISILAPAKVNLFFEILGRRSDGFHEIETLMAPINLYDRLTFTPNSSGRVTLDCRWAGFQSSDSPLGNLPPADENLALRGALLVQRRAGIAQGAELRLLKRIPAAAGLGGGSSDAAAALVAANLGWQLDWPTGRLRELAAELGSDVPFFLAGGAAICHGRGERVELVERVGPMFGVVVRPPAGLSTAEVYRRCRPGDPPRSAGPLLAALRRGDRRQLAGAMHNRLEEAAQKLSPWIERLQREFTSLGCTHARMSGSGTSYFAICRHARHARRVAGRLRCRRLGRVYAVRW